jgi:hypothetical protein
MNKPWSDLPNAHHIDWVLASMKENPELWDAAVDAADLAAGLAYAAWAAADTDAAWDVARDAAVDAAPVQVRDSLLALVAYDDCDQYLNMGYVKLKVYAVLSEKPQALLLLPMAYVLEKIKMP